MRVRIPPRALLTRDYVVSQSLVEPSC